jgi:hypothetical protein
MRTFPVLFIFTLEWSPEKLQFIMWFQFTFREYGQDIWCKLHIFNDTRRIIRDLPCRVCYSYSRNMCKLFGHIKSRKTCHHLNVSYLAETKESGAIYSAITNELDDRETVVIFSALIKSFRFSTVPYRLWAPPSLLFEGPISEFSFTGS